MKDSKRFDDGLLPSISAPRSRRLLALPAMTSSQTTPTKSLYDRYTEPIAIFKDWTRSFTKPISSTKKEAQADFDQGFQTMYSSPSR